MPKESEEPEVRTMTRIELAHRIARATMRSTPNEYKHYAKFTDCVWWSPVFDELKLRLPRMKYIWYDSYCPFHLSEERFVLTYIHSDTAAIPFIAKAIDNSKHYSYHPRSDASFLIDHLPFVLIEVESNADHRDEVRMVIQAACIVRLANAWIDTEPDDGTSDSQDHHFVIMAIYVEKPDKQNQIRAKRYLFYQPDRKNNAVSLEN